MDKSSEVDFLSSQAHVVPEGSSFLETKNTFFGVIGELKNELSIKTHRIQSLIRKFEKFQKNITNKITKKLITNKVKKEMQKDFVFPVEILDEIFIHCDARTRLNFSSICKGFNERYSMWREVNSVYITRKCIEFLPNKTIIPQSFVARTNVPRLALFHSTSLLAMAPRFSTVRQLFIESSEQPMASLTNRIPIQSGFFKHFQEVQFIKISNVGENLSLMYTLEELFSLPKLEVLHVREFKNNIALPRSCVIKAPLKELRLAIRLTKINRLEDIFDNLSGTLESLELVPLKTNSAIENNLGRHLFSMILMHLPDLKDVYLSHIITEHPSFRQNLHLLKTFSQLKSITFELMHLESLSDVLSNLPSTCETVVVTEAFYIQGETIGLAIRARFKWEQLFSSKRIELLQNELNGIRRKITIQLGRLRETCQITMCYKVTPFVTFVSNVTTHFPELLTLVEKRVFLFNTVIYKRENFLKKLGIVTNDSVS